MSADPIGPTGTEPDRCRCGSEIRPTGRCARGHVQAGNGLAVNTGHRSVAFWRDHEAQQRALVAAIVSDAGHAPADAPRALLEAAEGLAQAVAVRDAAFLRIGDEGGPLTSSGRGRRALGVWQDAAAAVERHLRLLGLKRVPKPARDLADLLAEVEVEDAA